MRFILELVFIGLILVLYSEGRCTRVSYTCYRPHKQRIIQYRPCSWLWRNRCQGHVTYINKYVMRTCYKFKSCQSQMKRSPNKCGRKVKDLACNTLKLHKEGMITLASDHFLE
ncbi:uncharacterized protein [Mytilus edulis]|uniref:uncharacterized protein n=1 Tax=Mytilus edulis TaxID=6550 RepID=UPI0039EF0058